MRKSNKNTPPDIISSLLRNIPSRKNDLMSACRHTQAPPRKNSSKHAKFRGSAGEWRGHARSIGRQRRPIGSRGSSTMCPRRRRRSTEDERRRKQPRWAGRWQCCGHPTWWSWKHIKTSSGNKLGKTSFARFLRQYLHLRYELRSNLSVLKPPTANCVFQDLGYAREKKASLNVNSSDTALLVLRKHTQTQI